MLAKVPSALSPSDVLTKYIDRSTPEKHLASTDFMMETKKQKRAQMLTHQNFGGMILSWAGCNVRFFFFVTKVPATVHDFITALDFPTVDSVGNVGEDDGA